MSDRGITIAWDPGRPIMETVSSTPSGSSRTACPVCAPDHLRRRARPLESGIPGHQRFQAMDEPSLSHYGTCAFGPSWAPPVSTRMHGRGIHPPP